MTQTAELRANDLEPAGFSGREMDRNLDARHEVLVNPQLTDIERVSYVFGAQEDLDGAVHRDAEGGGDDVILRVWIVVAVEPEEISRGIVNLVHVSGTELTIRTGVTEIVRELLALHLDLKGVRRHRSEVHFRPDLVPEQVESDKHNGGSNRPGCLELVVAVRVGRLATILPVAILPGEVAEPELGADEDDARQDQSDGELVVDGRPDGRDGVRRPPDVRPEDVHRDDGNQHQDDKKR